MIPLHGNSTNVETILNIICTSDICSDTLSVARCSHETYGVNIVIAVNINTPIIQKITYDKDVLLAAFVAPIEDMTDVTHAPICIPYTIYTAFGNANAPAAPSACNTPTVADELCTTAANTVPNSMPTIGLLTDFIIF